jgi:glutathione synthase/RimK-type ligase-like ATP-grasp enzyme
MTETLASANQKAIGLRQQGRLREAVAAFSEGIVLFPGSAILYNNLAQTLDELGAPKEALLAYESALMRAPHFVPSLIGKAGLLLRDGKIAEARAAYDAALAVEPESVAANLGLYELLQIQGDLLGAVEHQKRALARQQLFSHVAPREARSLLVLCAPGDWQANVPIDFLIDRATTTIHKLYLLENVEPPAALPRYDVVLDAIAESRAAVPYLELAERFARSQSAPVLNRAERVLAISRERLPQTLQSVDATVPAVTEISRESLAGGDAPLAYPFIVRPVGSHAGHDLARVANRAELDAYLEDAKAPGFFCSPFVDYKSEDGYFRKYRFVYVDGEAFPVHQAISPKWMIHYYNAPMAEHQWMRDEEAGFLRDPWGRFAGAIGEALRAVAPAVGLEYFGIDCAVGPDGRLLVFEADAAMLVHTTDPVDLYPYKHEFVPKIYRALEHMVDRRKGADT